VGLTTDGCGGCGTVNDDLMTLDSVGDDSDLADEFPDDAIVAAKKKGDDDDGIIAVLIG
jgi:hypothetical protein